MSDETAQDPDPQYDEANNPGRRVQDSSFSRWMTSHIDLATRVWLVIISVVVLAAVLIQQHRNDVSSRNSTASCNRSKIYGPALAKLYGTEFRTKNGGTFQVLSDKSARIGEPSPLQAYKDSIPKNCD